MHSIDPTWACAQIVHRLFQYMDDGKSADAAALFVEDGIWNKRGSLIAGRQAIEASLRERPATVASRHLVTNIVIDADGPIMHARYYVTTFADNAFAGGISPIQLPVVILVCEDQLEEIPDGWRFRLRTSKIAFSRL